VSDARAAALAAGSAEAAARCSDAARDRGDPLLATAPPARRLLLIEVPGPWGRAGLTGSRLAAEVTVPLAAAADAAGVRVQLIRRPGRHAGPRRPGAMATAGTHAWGIADPDVGAVRWGRWRDEHDLLRIDLRIDLGIDLGVDLGAACDPATNASTGPQRLALVCTHARHDVCCAVRGRPVAAAVSAGSDRDVWETSHLGGDRFAANLLLLPEGEVFGGLDPDSAPVTIELLDAGRLDLEHYRGRVGRSPLEQAAVQLVARAVDDDRLGAVRVRGATALGADRWQLSIDHRGRDLRAVIAASWAEPERLTCAALAAKPSQRFALESIAVDDPLDDQEAQAWQVTG
jgi:hypothetical protein